MGKTKKNLALAPRNARLAAAAAISAALLASGIYAQYDRPPAEAQSAAADAAMWRDEIRRAFPREKYDSTARARIERARGRPMGNGAFGAQWTVSVSKDGEFFRVGLAGLREEDCIKLGKAVVEGAVDPITLLPFGRPVTNGQYGCGRGDGNAVEWMFR
ncbi:MAG: hypothetical protein LBT92_01115 [Rickettsiales bacterium]|jgi:hypothetical protein|nr:hypothetical protein [Rickettsiales bacterium]